MIGIDPGSMKLGLAVLWFDVTTMTIVKTESRTVRVDKMVKDNPLVETMGELFARLYKLQHMLTGYFNAIQPVMIATETPYYNPRRPSAYGPLVKVITMIEEAVVKYNPEMGLTYIAPSTVKARVNANTLVRDKDNVIECVRNLPDLFYDGEIPFDQLDDNGADGLAIVYGAFHNLVREKCLITSKTT
jgi:hypothetical protein